MFRKGFFRSKEKDVINEVEVFDNPNDWQKLRSALLDEVLEVCLDPEELAARLTDVLFKRTGRSYGHVHFHFRNKSDHIIFFWADGQVDKILAKSSHSKKGQYTHWVDSEFSDYERKDVLKELHNEIERIKIDDGFKKTWRSYAKFIIWLVESQK